jgi:hypothetical protein
MPNAALVALALPFYAKVTEILLQTLRLSVVSVSLSNQLALTTSAIALAKTVDFLNRGLKAKCLANPAWASDCERALNEFTGGLATIHGLAEVARGLADEEDTKHSETRGKIFAVLTPLRALLPRLDTNQKILAAMDPSASREICSVLVKLAGSGATLMGRVLLHAKDQGRESDALEKSLALGRDTLNIVQSVVDATRGELPRLDAIQQLTTNVIETLGRFAPEVNLSAAEGKELREQAALILQGASSLQATVQHAIEQPAAAPKPKSGLTPPPGFAGKPGPGPPAGDAAGEAARRGPSKPVSLINSKESQERLMTRLGLESRVNMWRWRLEFLEKELAAINA